MPKKRRAAASPRQKPRAARRANTPTPERPHMPAGYGVSQKKRGLLPFSWAERRLARSHNYYFSSTTPDGKPHTMVVWGLWLDRAFVFSTGSGTRKARNLAANPACVVCTEDVHEAVILEGRAELADLALRRRFLPIYERKYDFDMSSMAGDILALKEPVFIVRPRVAFGMVEKAFGERATRWRFEA
jgi:pyridoxamine 5'-phosphate oxidase-like protein